MSAVIAALGNDLDLPRLRRLLNNWDLSSHPKGRPVVTGDRFQTSSGDVVTSAPELARLTLNLAAVHHDSSIGNGSRLVYGGHTIGLAATQMCMMLPGLVTLLGWRSCDHLAPVREGDTLTSQLVIESADELPNGGQLVSARSIVQAVSEPDKARSHVLDWRVVGVVA